MNLPKVIGDVSNRVSAIKLSFAKIKKKRCSVASIVGALALPLSKLKHLQFKFRLCLLSVLAPDFIGELLRETCMTTIAKY